MLHWEAVEEQARGAGFVPVKSEMPIRHPGRNAKVDDQRCEPGVPIRYERLAGATNTGVLRRWKVFNSMILDEGTEKRSKDRARKQNSVQRAARKMGRPGECDVPQVQRGGG